MRIELENECGFSARINDKYVGIYMGTPDTVVLIFQRPDSQLPSNPLTTSLPISWEAFAALIEIGNKVLAGRKKEEK